MKELEIQAPSLDSSLRRRDYHWIEITPDEFAEMLAKKFKAIGAKAFLLDVYCSNDSVYRNLVVKWKGFSSIKSLKIHFNREEGNIIDARMES